MSASDSFELVVVTETDGIEETERELDGMSDSFDETTDEVGDTTSRLEGFTRHFRGAMKAVVASLAVASAGLLSTVPVIGELMSGLFSIIEAIGFQMDQVLRPVLQPLTERFFEWSNAIFEADGALGTLIGVLGTAVTLFTGLAAAALTLGAAKSAIVGASAGLVAALKVVGTAVAALVAVLGAPVIIAAAVTAAIALLAWHFRADIVNAIHTAIGAIGDFIDWLGDGLNAIGSFVADGGRAAANFASDVASAFASLVTDAGRSVSRLASDALSTLQGMASGAFRAGRSFVQSFIDGIRAMIRRVRDEANRIAQIIRDRLPSSDAKAGPLSDLSDSGKALVDTFAASVEGEVRTIESASDAVGEAAAPTLAAGGVGRQNRNLRREFQEALERTDKTGDLINTFTQEHRKLRRTVNALADELDVDVHVDGGGRHDPF